MHFLSCRHQHNLLRRKENCDDTNSMSTEFNLVLVPVPKYQYRAWVTNLFSRPRYSYLYPYLYSGTDFGTHTRTHVESILGWYSYSDLVPKPILEYLYPYSDTCIHTRVPNLVLVRSTVPSFGINYCSQIPKMGTVRV